MPSKQGISMMYRRHAAQHSARAADNLVAQNDKASGHGTLEGFFAALMKLGVFAQAERENRRYNRAQKRWKYHASYAAAGLNGARAVARRRRQIANGSLRSENGLCA
jgi:hypothetical protein